MADFTTVTELPGTDMSSEQFARHCNRYYWAQGFVKDANVLEVGCGSGIGLAYLSKTAGKTVGLDVSDEVLAHPRRMFSEVENMTFKTGDGVTLPFDNAQFDVVMIFEALYYLSDAEVFFKEVNRVLKPGGELLVINANKDLFDFNPSPFSTEYHGTVELEKLAVSQGMEVELFGSTPFQSVSLRQKIIRPIKAFAVKFGLIPKTMSGKKLLKKLVFGKMMQMPNEITDNMVVREKLFSLPKGQPNLDYKCIHLVATKPTR